MKKLITLLFSLVLIFSFSLIQANTQNYQKQKHHNVSKSMPHIIVGVAAIARAAYQYATQRSKFLHIFGSSTAKHNLAPLIRAYGSEQALLKTVTQELAKRVASRRLRSGNFKEIMYLRGYEVVVKGYVGNNIPKIGTLYIRY